MTHFANSIFTAVLLTLLTTSCITYKAVTIDEIKSVKLKDGNISSGKIITTLKINNPNNYAIKIKKYNLSAFINGQDMGALKIEESMVIAKKSNDDHVLTFQPDVSKIFSMLPVFLQAGTVDAAIKGEVKVKALIFSKSFPVDLKKKVSTKDFQ